MNNIELKKIRKNLKLSQTDFADKLSVSMRTVQNWEAGINAIPKIVEYVIDKLLDEIESSKENKTYTSYYLPEVYASAGLDKGIINDELKRVPVNIPWLETGLTFINVYGDSMYPKYNAGEVIGVKPIEFKYLNYGYPYVIVFSNGDVFIKIVQPGADKDHLMLESVNEFYKPKEFHLEQMKSFYSIKGVIKKEMM